MDCCEEDCVCSVDDDDAFVSSRVESRCSRLVDDDELLLLDDVFAIEEDAPESFDDDSFEVGCELTKKKKKKK